MFNDPGLSSIMDRYRSSMPWLRGGTSGTPVAPSAAPAMPWQQAFMSGWPGMGQSAAPSSPMPSAAMSAAPSVAPAAPGQAPPMPGNYGNIYSMLGVPNGANIWQQHWQGEQDAAAAQKRAASGDLSYILPQFNTGGP